MSKYDDIIYLMGSADYSLERIRLLRDKVEQADIDVYHSHVPPIVPDVRDGYTNQSAVHELVTYRDESAYLRARYLASRALGETVFGAVVAAAFPR